VQLVGFNKYWSLMVLYVGPRGSGLVSLKGCICCVSAHSAVDNACVSKLAWF
jgi:hypothetical protein